MSSLLYDSEYFQCSKITNKRIPSSEAGIREGSKIKGRPALPAQNGRPPVKGRSAIPATYNDKGEMISPDIPSVPGVAAIPSKKAKPAIREGYWFYVSASTFETLREIVARLKRKEYTVSRGLQLASEFPGKYPFLLHRYVVQYFVSDPKTFRKAFAEVKKGK
jgi:hypothetical protein